VKYIKKVQEITPTQRRNDATFLVNDTLDFKDIAWDTPPGYSIGENPIYQAKKKQSFSGF